MPSEPAKFSESHGQYANGDNSATENDGNLFSVSDGKGTSGLESEADHCRQCLSHRQDCKEDTEDSSMDLTAYNHGEHKTDLCNVISIKQPDINSGVEEKSSNSVSQQIEYPQFMSEGNEYDLMNNSCDDLDLLTKSTRAVVLKILGYISIKDLLHNVCLVKKSWCEMVFDPMLWQRLNLQRYKINDNVLNILPTLCSFISYILLPDDTSEDFTDAGLIALAKGCPNLRVFYAPRSGSHFSEDAYIAITEYCKELRELHLDHLELTNKTVESIARNLRNLEFLTLNQSGSFTNEAIGDVIKCCRNLQDIRLNHNKQITSDCFSTLSESSKSLEVIEVMMCNIDPVGVKQLSVLRNLRELNLTQCSQLTDEDLLPVLKECKKLNSLSLNLDKQLNDDSIEIIFTHLPNMYDIYLVSTNITDKALEIMADKGKSLVHVDVGYTKVTAFGARLLSENCPDLVWLSLMNCKSVDDSSVDELVEEFPHIWYSNFAQEAKKLLKLGGYE